MSEYSRNQLAQFCVWSFEWIHLKRSINIFPIEFVDSHRFKKAIIELLMKLSATFQIVGYYAEPNNDQYHAIVVRRILHTFQFFSRSSFLSLKRKRINQVYSFGGSSTRSHCHSFVNTVWKVLGTFGWCIQLPLVVIHSKIIIFDRLIWLCMSSIWRAIYYS